MTFKASALLLNVNNNKVSLKNEHLKYVDTSKFSGDISISFWLYVSKYWFPNQIIDDVFLFAINGMYGVRIYTDESNVVWLELYRILIKLIGPNPVFYKESVCVHLDRFYNRWHNIVITIPSGFKDSDYGFLYYDGEQCHRNIVEQSGGSSASIFDPGFFVGYHENAVVNASNQEITQYSHGNFIGYLFDLVISDKKFTSNDVLDIYNSGIPHTNWIFSELKNYGIQQWARLQDTKNSIFKFSYIKDDYNGNFNLKPVLSRENRFNKVSKLPTKSLLSESQLYLEKTRNNNTYKNTTIPEKDFQNLWFQNCAVAKSRFYDLHGKSSVYANGVEKTSTPFDEDLIFKKESGGVFSKTTNGVSDSAYIYFELPEFQGQSGIMVGTLFFLVKIDHTTFADPALVGKSVFFVVDFALNHTTDLQRGNDYFDTYPNYICGPITDPPINPDIDDMSVNYLHHTGLKTGNTWELRLSIPSYTGAEETITYKYSWLYQYSYIDTSDYIS